MAPAASAALLQVCGYAKGGTAADDEVPPEKQQMQPFSVSLKQLEEVVTQDLLPADALEANRRALATLKQFARSLESPHGYPPAYIKVVMFTFRDPYAEGQLRRVRCQLKTTGGNCAQLVQQNIGHLLLRLGLPPYFYFDGDQFRPKAPPKPHVAPKPRPAAAAPKAAPPGPEKVEAVRARAAAAGFPSQTISEEQFRDMQAQSESAQQEKATAVTEQAAAMTKIRQLDPLLQAVAAVPWLAASEDQQSRDRVPVIRSRVMDEIESWGWDVRGAVRRVWSGERHLGSLLDGKDAGTQLAIKAIHFYSLQNDKKMGRQTYSAS
ncbi:expressed protein [Chlorella variabilis]|uniref:Expressed protein n=1 Tax=Chlorella variabilis TaxID=554065 RepID=E1Z4L2_CHLVA|nr:expressed protein [Chlorella variabilis]EFN59079.1 expressed protein [Chlorella variabilis]|eukprot:XP_005851181.1 expressed protein [Chlorella variabilis]